MIHLIYLIPITIFFMWIIWKLWLRFSTEMVQQIFILPSGERIKSTVHIRTLAEQEIMQEIYQGEHSYITFKGSRREMGQEIVIPAEVIRKSVFITKIKRRLW